MHGLSSFAIGHYVRALYLESNVLFRLYLDFIGGIFLKIHTSHFTHMLYTRLKFGCDRSEIKGTFLGSSVLCQPYFGFNLRDFPRNSYLHSPFMRYKRCVFVCDRSPNKGTWLWKQMTVSAVSRLPWEGLFFENSYLRFSCMRYKRRKYGCDLSLIKGTSFGEHCAFEAISRLPWEGFSWIFIPRTFHHRRTQNFPVEGWSSEAIYNLFDFKNCVTKIMTKSRSRHLVRLQGKCKLTKNKVYIFVRSYYIFRYSSALVINSYKRLI
jgi:hypothetical protein